VTVVLVIRHQRGCTGARRAYEGAASEQREEQKHDPPPRMRHNSAPSHLLREGERYHTAFCYRNLRRCAQTNTRENAPSTRAVKAILMCVNQANRACGATAYRTSRRARCPSSSMRWIRSAAGSHGSVGDADGRSSVDTMSTIGRAVT
jgi:hypothetical protein